MTSFDMAEKRFQIAMQQIDADTMLESLSLSYDDYFTYYESEEDEEDTQETGKKTIKLDLKSSKKNKIKKPNKIVELATRIYNAILRLVQDVRTAISEMFSKKDDLTFDSYRNARDVKIQLDYDIKKTQHNARINFLRGKKLVQTMAKMGKKSDVEVAEYVNQWNKWMKVHGESELLRAGVDLKLKKDSGELDKMGDDMKEILHLITTTSAKDPESGKMMYKVFRTMAGYVKEYNKCTYDLHQRLYAQGAPVKKPRQKFFGRY